MKPRLLFMLINLALLAAWLGKVFPNSWPEGN